MSYIMPVHRELPWLPVCQIIKYKLVMTVYKCLHALAPMCLSDNCLAISAITGKQHLQSVGTGLLGMSFVVAGPVIWNSLPNALCTTTVSP